MFTIIGGEYLKRWEKDREIQVNDSSVDKVYFTTKARDGAVEVEVSGGIAKVPNGLLQQAHDITVYGYVGDKCKLKVLAVKDREKPEDYYYYDGYKENVENIESGIAPKVLDECIREMEDIPNGGSGTGGGVSSWNDLTDKPFEEYTVMGDTLTWDGDMTGRVYVQFDAPIDEEGNTAPMYFVKVSDAVPTIENLQSGGSYGMNKITQTFEVADVYEDEFIPYILLEIANIFIFKEDNLDITDVVGTPTIIPEAGTYFAFTPISEIMIDSFTINNYTGFERTEIKTLDNKYLEPYTNLYRTVFYTDSNYTKLYTDVEEEVLATVLDVVDAHDKGEILIKNPNGRENSIVSFKDNSPVNVVLEVFYSEGNGDQAVFKPKTITIGSMD